VIVRENTEDLYAGLEHEVVPGVVESLKIITEKASTRIAEFAFEHARAQRPQARDGDSQSEHHEARRRAVPRVHARASPAVPGHQYDETDRRRRVHAAGDEAAQFDVLLLPNLYGDIVSDLCAGWSAAGLVGAANLGAELAVFEAVHGSAPDIAGKHLANPTALLLSAVMMLRHIDEARRADRIMTALRRGARRRRGAHARSRGTSSTMDVRRRGGARVGLRSVRAILRLASMLDDIAQAVLAREEVLKYPRDQVNAYLEELRTTQRHKFYRALQHPLYPILRKIERKHENLHHVIAAVRSHRIVYASNHKSHTDYLVEPLVLDDNGIRPPLIAAGINLYGGRSGCSTATSPARFRSAATARIRRI
jgi:hypothetical protein